MIGFYTRTRYTTRIIFGMRPACFAALSLLFMLMSTSDAQQKKIHEEDECCCSTFDTGQCLNKVSEKVEAELNATYQTARKKQAADGEQLKVAQRAWLAFRKA